MVPRETSEFRFPSSPIVSFETPGLSGKQNELFREGPLIKAPFTLQKIFGTARIKMVRVPQKKVRLGEILWCK